MKYIKLKNDQGSLHHPVPCAVKSRASLLRLLDPLLLLILIELPAASVKVHLGEADKLGLVVELPAEPEDKEQGNADISGDEAAGAPLAVEEDSETGEQEHENEEDDTKVGKVGLEGGGVREGVARNAMVLEAVVESSIGAKNDDPRNDNADGANGIQVVEGLLGTSRAARQVGKGTEDGGHDERPDRQTCFGTLAKEARCLVLESKCVERPGRGVEVRVGSRPCNNDQYSVDDVRQDPDACVGDGQDEGRGAGIAASVEETRVVVGDDEADHEDGQDIEEKDTPEDALDGLGDVLARVLDLTDSNTNDFGTSEGEGRLDKDVPEGEEAAERAADTAGRCAGDGVGSPEKLSHRAGVLPEVEADAVTTGASTEVDDERGDDENNDGNHLDEAEPELGLSIVLDTESVNTDDKNKENRDPDGGVDGLVGIPVLNDDRRGRNLGGDGDTIRIPIGPTKGETETWVEEASGVVSETTGDGKQGADLAKGNHHRVDDNTHDHVGNEGADGTGVGQRAAKTDEETCADGTAKGNHGDMPLLEVTLYVTIARVLVHAEALEGSGIILVGGTLFDAVGGGVRALLHVRRKDGRSNAVVGGHFGMQESTQQGSRMFEC